MIKRLLTDHPAAVGETYGEHFAAAGFFARQLCLAALACAVHAVFPFLFEKTASGIIRRLHERMVVSRQETAGAAGVSARGA